MASQRDRNGHVGPASGSKSGTESGRGTRRGESQIEFSRAHGLLTVRDPRMFARGQEAFCRALAVAAAVRADVRSAIVDLGAGTFRMEYRGGRPTEAEMAEGFAAAVNTAIDDRREAADEESRGDRRSGDDAWASLAAFRSGTTVSSWEIVHQAPDCLKLRNLILRHDSDLGRRLARELRRSPGIVSARVSPLRRDLKVRFETGQMTDSAVASLAERLLRNLLHPGPGEIVPDPSDGPTVEIAAGARRVYYLAMAAGSFSLTGLGLLVPGIPTVPFLLATSYYLARSSPTLNRALLNSKFFGPILQDLQASGGLRRTNRWKLVGLTIVLVGGTILLTAPPLGLLGVIAALSALSLYGISRIPEIPDATRRMPEPVMA